jgi:hypothetical protein
MTDHLKINQEVSRLLSTSYDNLPIKIFFLIRVLSLLLAIKQPSKISIGINNKKSSI